MDFSKIRLTQLYAPKDDITIWDVPIFGHDFYHSSMDGYGLDDDSQFNIICRD